MVVRPPGLRSLARAPRRLDQDSLQLHNLLYEKNHYLREIARCRDFRSKHLAVQLVDESTFAATAPAELQGDAEDPHQVRDRRVGSALCAPGLAARAASSCCHPIPARSLQLMLNRLTFELQERER